MSVKSTLIATKALIDTPEKWVKGTPFKITKKGCSYCLSGALNEVTGDFWPRRSARAALIDQINFGLPLHTRSIVGFNDNPSTTHADVMKLLDKAIERAV